MRVKSRADRYSEAVALEIKNKNFRAPIWKQALTVARGNIREAEDLYTTMRVQQMEQDEELHQQAQQEKAAKQNLQDQAKPFRFLSKTLFFAFLALLFFALFFLILFLVGLPAR